MGEPPTLESSPLSGVCVRVRISGMQVVISGAVAYSPSSRDPEQRLASNIQEEAQVER